MKKPLPICKRFAVGSEGKINEIKDELKKSKVVGADETSATVNGKKWCMHTYQNASSTFIGAHPSRGQAAQETFCPGGASLTVSRCMTVYLCS